MGQAWSQTPGTTAHGLRDSALASVVADELRPDHIIPSPFDPRVAPAVAEAVASAARLNGVTRR